MPATRRPSRTRSRSPQPIEGLKLAPTPGNEVEVADKGYHAREVLKRLAAGAWTSRIAEPARRTMLRWHGDDDARRAVYTNRAHVLDRGGMSRTRLRGPSLAHAHLREGETNHRTVKYAFSGSQVRHRRGERSASL